MQENQRSSDELIALIIDGVEDVKGVEINLLDLREIDNTVCDFFHRLQWNFKYSCKRYCFFCAEESKQGYQN